MSVTGDELRSSQPPLRHAWSIWPPRCFAVRACTVHYGDLPPVFRVHSISHFLFFFKCLTYTYKQEQGNKSKGNIY